MASFRTVSRRSIGFDWDRLLAGRMTLTRPNEAKRVAQIEWARAQLHVTSPTYVDAVPDRILTSLVLATGLDSRMPF